ncbi:hypothetical protein L0156_09235 [bacterium]|nr:hypothetical protein [bacterium]
MKCYLWATLLLSLLGCSGEEIYSTPEKTLERYVQNRRQGTAMAMEASLNCFPKEDKKWWDAKYLRICELKYGKFNAMCGEGLANRSALWNDLVEPRGPKSTNVSSSDVDDKEGVATLIVDGQEVYFIRESNNWKLDGLFGIREELTEQWPELKEM